MSNSVINSTDRVRLALVGAQPQSPMVAEAAWATEARERREADDPSGCSRRSCGRIALLRPSWMPRTSAGSFLAVPVPTVANPGAARRPVPFRAAGGSVMQFSTGW